MSPMSLSELIRPWLGEVDSDVLITGLSLDSRSVRSGDLFFALTGNQCYGKEYVPQAMDNGAVAILSDQHLDSCGTQWPVYVIDALPELVSAIAGRFYTNPSAPMTIFAVTGTNGKTSCAQWIAQLSQQLGRRAGMLGTLGYGLIGETLQDTGMTTPDPIAVQSALHELHAQGCDSVAMEVSSHALAQHRVDGVRFNVALFTNISRDHLDYHGTMNAYQAAKKRLFDMPNLDAVVVNIDDTTGQEIYRSALEAPHISYSYSMFNADADIYADAVAYHEAGLTFRLVSPWGDATCELPFYGAFNVHNILGVIGCLCSSGFAFEQVVQKVSQLAPVPGRMQVVSKEVDDITVVVDYAHTPDALEKSLVALRAHAPGEIVCVFGCGGDRDRGKRGLMAKVVESHAEDCVVTSDNPRSEDPKAIVDDICEGFTDADYSVVVERECAIETAILNADAGSVILIAGKGHENYQEIDGVKYPFSDVEKAVHFLERRLRVAS